MDHAYELLGLTAGTAYVIRVTSVDASGNPTVSPDLEVTTAPPAVEEIPIRISNVSLVGRTTSQAIIEWSTNLPSSSDVEYGLSSTLGIFLTQSGAGMVFEHRVTLSRLSEDTPYFYRVRSGDAVSDVSMFRTRVPVPPVPAVITEGPLVRGIGQDRATMFWKTDVVSNSVVEYDVTETFSTSIVSDPDPVTDHSVTLTGLSESTTYFYRVSSSNLARLTTESDVFSFRTLDAPDETPPSILELSFPVRTSDGFTMTFKTDEIAGGQVIYTSPDGVEASRADPEFVQDHSLSVDDLDSETTYVVLVRSTDPSGNVGESVPREVTTLEEEIVDDSAPVLDRPPSAAGTTHESATIVWGTDEPATSVVAYGTSEDDLSEEQGDPRRFKRGHSVRLTNLLSTQKYFFRIFSTDQFGNGPAVADGMFTTKAEPDMTSPIISELEVVSGSATDESIDLSWRTDEPTDTQVEYAGGLDLAAPELTIQVTDPSAVTEHGVTLTNLSASTTYSFRVGARDVAGNPRSYSEIRTFTTEETPDTIPPDFVGTVATSERTSTTITLVYTTDEPTNTVVEYGTRNYRRGRIERGSFELSRSVAITGLTPETAYRFRITCRDQAGNGVTTDPTITIPPEGTRLRFLDIRERTTTVPDEIAPEIVRGPIVWARGRRAVVIYVTDELSDTRVIYALPENYNQPGLESEVFSPRLVKVHRVTLSVNLKKHYLYRVLSTDAAGNTGSSEPPGSTKPVEGLALQPPGGDGSFVTPPTPDTSPPVIISGPTLVGATSTSLTLEYQTDEAGDSFAEYGPGDALENRIEDGTPVTKHRLVLTKLSPGTTYGFVVGSTDPSLNGPATSKLAVGSTSAEVDATPPVVEDVTVSYKSDRQAIITWKTNEPGSSSVEYGLGGELSLVRSTPDPVAEHSVVLTNLSAGASYSFRAGSLDLSNNGPTWSSTLAFDTDPTPDTTPPDIPEDPEVSAITDRTAVVKWTTDEVSDSGVEFGTSASSLDFNIGSSEVVKDHREVLTGLEPATTYFLQVSSTDRSGNGPTFGPAQGQTVSFTTEAAPDMIAPAQVSFLLGLPGSRTVLLTWRKGGEADLSGYNVYRGTGEDPLSLIASNLADARFEDTGLADEVPYRYAVTAFDGSGNEGERSDEVTTHPFGGKRAHGAGLPDDPGRCPDAHVRGGEWDHQ